MKNSFSNLSDLGSALGRTSTTNDAPKEIKDDALVYSTEVGRISKKKEKIVTDSDGFAKVRRETKGRKGKGVIVISGLGIDNNALKELAKKIKKTCGTGGSVVNETIEIQGDKRQEIKQVLETLHFKVKFTGG